MIKANELRIGNWILDAGGNYIKITAQRIADIDNKLVISKPIHLTEELLLKCGFEKITKRESYYKKGSIWGIGVDDTMICLDPDWREQPSFHCGIEYTDSEIPHDENIQYNFAHDIKYLHQLQNLYFALTNQELEINL